MLNSYFYFCNYMVLNDNLKLTFLLYTDQFEKCTCATLNMISVRFLLQFRVKLQFLFNVAITSSRLYT
jgi:hypothetical protein